MPALPVSNPAHPGPELAFVGLDVLWLQVGGTLCNLACRHCFVSCGPGNDSHALMDPAQVEATLDQARALGVKEIYFTGGEPFLHPRIEELIEMALRVAPLTILTNGMLIDRKRAQRLARLGAGHAFSLELRVSLDGASAEENDPIRGHDSFERILAGARALDEAGLLPVFSITTVHQRYESAQGRLELLERLRELGFQRPRVKTIPPFRIGREAAREHGYPEDFRLDADELPAGAEWSLQCGSSRTVSSRGVYPCPILIEEEGSRLGENLGEVLAPLRLNHAACRTCHVEGFTCRT